MTLRRRAATTSGMDRQQTFSARAGVQKLRNQEVLDASVLRGEAWRVARRLLGALLVDTSGVAPVVGRIVETEAYCANDAASHSARGQTPRNHAMFGRAGLAYVYRSYGLHWCVNVSCTAEGEGAAVLLRALEPLAGLDVMRERRLPATPKALQLCRGPGNLARALRIDLRHNGLDLLHPKSSLRLVAGAAVPAANIRRSPRIGITRAVDKLWRFYVVPSAFVSAARNGQPLRAERSAR